MNAKVDAYIARSTKWPHEMTALRSILLECELTEELKWGKPCFSHHGRNIVIMQEMKDFLALMFFKGALLEDPQELLRSQGPNSRSAKRLTFTSVAEVSELAEMIGAYIDEAIDIEDKGLEVEPAPELVLCEELQRRIDDDEEFRTAFENLTPGRQREYHLQISQAKQATTRQARVDKFAPKILQGKGFRDR